MFWSLIYHQMGQTKIYWKSGSVKLTGTRPFEQCAKYPVTSQLGLTLRLLTSFCTHESVHTMPLSQNLNSNTNLYSILDCKNASFHHFIVFRLWLRPEKPKKGACPQKFYFCPFWGFDATYLCKILSVLVDWRTFLWNIWTLNSKRNAPTSILHGVST